MLKCNSIRFATAYICVRLYKKKTIKCAHTLSFNNLRASTFCKYVNNYEIMILLNISTNSHVFLFSHLSESKHNILAYYYIQ